MFPKLSKMTYVLICIPILCLMIFYYQSDGIGQTPEDNGTGALFPIKQNGNYGYIDKTGKIIIKPQFNSGSDFSEELALVYLKGTCCYIDKTGKVVIQLDSSTFGYPFSGGIARVDSKNFIEASTQQAGKFGYIDKTGKYIWKPLE